MSLASSQCTGSGFRSLQVGGTKSLGTAVVAILTSSTSRVGGAGDGRSRGMESQVHMMYT